MSGYNYDDRTNCRDCRSKYEYTDLKNLTNYQCDQPCICRFTNERSTKDKMYYDIFVLGKNVNIPPQKPSLNWLEHTYEENNTL